MGAGGQQQQDIFPPGLSPPYCFRENIVFSQTLTLSRPGRSRWRGPSTPRPALSPNTDPAATLVQKKKKEKKKSRLTERWEKSPGQLPASPGRKGKYIHGGEAVAESRPNTALSDEVNRRSQMRNPKDELLRNQETMATTAGRATGIQSERQKGSLPRPQERRPLPSSTPTLPNIKKTHHGEKPLTPLPFGQQRGQVQGWVVHRLGRFLASMPSAQRCSPQPPAHSLPFSLCRSGALSSSWPIAGGGVRRGLGARRIHSCPEAGAGAFRLTPRPSPKWQRWGKPLGRASPSCDPPPAPARAALPRCPASRCSRAAWEPGGLSNLCNSPRSSKAKG